MKKCEDSRIAKKELLQKEKDRLAPSNFKAFNKAFMIQNVALGQS